MKDVVDTTTTYYVVRTKRKGKFIRAFITEAQAQRWCNDQKNWVYFAEQAHDYDADGCVFDTYKAAN